MAGAWMPGIGVALHVGEVEAAAWAQTLLGNPLEAGPEVGAAPALQRDLLGQVAGGIIGGVLQSGVDLQDEDGLRLQFGGDLAHLVPECGESPGWQRGRGVDNDGDRADPLRAY